MSFTATPRTWVSGETVTALELNTEIRDALLGLQAVWTVYTPTLTGITLGNGSLAASYMRVGWTVTARCQLVAGSTTTYSAVALAFGLPVSCAANYATTGAYAVGSGIVQPGAAATRVTATPHITTGGNLNFMVNNGTANAIVTNLVPGTFGTSATISWTVTYEAS